MYQITPLSFQRSVCLLKATRDIFSVLPLEKSSDSDRKDLLSELELMKKLKSHPHVIRLMGCVTETGNLQLD